ncbi:MAG: bifunctional phosphoribosylaminoimidazolecarboxamide formyltransferase/IMP cyclohydrolase [Alphaproteobacteria bacterium]|nr:bifunctional phosphoribosylaminoimidazolecarboxamide formyltransferase/IMP cyclohydrolase [Alphaproteobacteria bacterium]
MSDAPVIRRALISVSDKTGLADLGRGLAGLGITILSTGGTARALAAAGVAVTEVADHTGFPELLDGRVKTLHPMIHGGILARRDASADQAALAAHGIAAIDLVVVNLYPFEATVASGAGRAHCIENIDIGGPALLRSAAKNHRFVTVVCDPADYDELVRTLAARGGATDLALRQRLAAKAYAATAAYDAAIATWFAAEEGERLPERVILAGRRREVLRYGENPHQEAAFYLAGAARPGVATAEQVQGKALSYNNLNDTDAACELVAEFRDRPAVAIIKHANPCGVAEADTLVAAYGKALACDPVSAFGGVIALNRPLDGATAAEIAKLFTEVIIAPGAETAALAALASKPNLRLLLIEELPDPAAPGLVLRALAGGFLVQTRDGVMAGELEVVTRRAPSAAELADLRFAFAVAKHVKSNAIVYVKDGATVGIGAGQMSRVDAARIAAAKAREVAAAAAARPPATIGSVVASDAFFPFADGVLAAAEAGARAVIQPGGSVRDDEVIAAADRAGLAMVFTGIRHFRH